ncbi:hypothetical protein CDAR_76851 [Caerostris darwini]|uniref:Uncharacterized protein n=1 Tax=Caerostris darwini TaxID=1538125 RepID=A0AAV4QFQ3_9ARAC|nr:hypothetical protein CDAR_76851 [Caerostris darwini]
MSGHHCRSALEVGVEDGRGRGFEKIRQEQREGGREDKSDESPPSFRVRVGAITGEGCLPLAPLPFGRWVVRDRRQWIREGSGPGGVALFPNFVTD